MGVDPTLIGRFGLFAALDDEARRALAVLATLEQVPTGSVVFDEGASADCIYLVVRGRVSLCMRLAGRPECCFLTLGEGELLGWSGLLRSHFVATARAAEPTELLRLPASELLALCDRDPRIGYAVMSRAFQEVAERLQETRLQLMDLFGRPGV